MATKIQRNYSKETTIGDIMYNTKTKTVFFNIQMGFMGRKSINLVQNQEQLMNYLRTMELMLISLIILK